MISDVLSDGVHAIDKYQRDFGIYEGLTTEISLVTTLMDALRMYLDSVPSPGLKAHQEALLAAIRQVDVSGVRLAQSQLSLAVTAMKAAAEANDDQEGQGRFI